MFFNDPVCDQGFQTDDGLILAQPLLLELKEILPVPASTGFWLHDPTCRQNMHSVQSSWKSCIPGRRE